MKDNPDKQCENLDRETLKDYAAKYDEATFWNSLKKYAGVMGRGLLYKALQLWYVLKKPDLPESVRVTLLGALGYLITPLDFLPDFTPVIGYCDDLAAITVALGIAAVHLDDEVNAKALAKLEEVLGRADKTENTDKKKQK